MKKCIYSLVFLLSFSVFSGILSGCSISDKKDAPEVTLTVHSPFNENYIGATFKKAKASFEETHPGVTVKYIYASNTDYIKNLTELITSDQSPDLILSGYDVIQYFEKKGTIKDLVSFIKKDNLNLRDYFDESLIQMSQNKTGHIAIPMNLTPQVVLYSKPLFKSAGVAEPKEDWTWEEFAETARKLKSTETGKSNPYVTIFPASALFLSTLVQSKGGSYSSPDGSTLLGYLDGAKSVEAISWYAGLVQEGVFNADYMQKVSDQLNLGRVGMVVGNYTEIAQLTPEARNNVGIRALPRFNGGVKANPVDAAGVAIPEKAKHADVAWEFIKFLALEKNEVTEEMLQKYDYSLSQPVVQLKKDDPYYNVKIQSLKYATENISKINSLQIEVWSMFSSELLGIVKKSKDIKGDLTNLAMKLDSEKAKYNKAE